MEKLENLEKKVDALSAILEQILAQNLGTKSPRWSIPSASEMDCAKLFVPSGQQSVSLREHFVLGFCHF